MIQHSMITRSIERAQKKVEENNFGIRKRLLEYDDVMNKQRSVIYSKRNHALFGERLAIDIDNSFYEVAENIVTTQRENGDYEAFKLDAILNFAIDTTVTEEELHKGNVQEVAEKLYAEATANYHRRTAEVTNATLPVIQNIYKEQGHQIENISIPFTDGKKGINVLAPLKKVVDTEGRETTAALERSITLALIDEAWKEHLRAMDDLKQSVQSAVYEQKDPLLIYKFEAFELFRQMNTETSKEIVSFLCKCGIPGSQGENEQITEGHEEKTDMSRMRASHQEFENGNGGGQRQQEYAPVEEPVRSEPVRVGPKVGRNDPCPCGSGKKFKNCHGKDL